MLSEGFGHSGPGNFRVGCYLASVPRIRASPRYGGAGFNYTEKIAYFHSPNKTELSNRECFIVKRVDLSLVQIAKISTKFESLYHLKSVGSSGM